MLPFLHDVLLRDVRVAVDARDARALHPFGRGVLAQRLAHLVGKGLGLELGLELLG